LQLLVGIGLGSRDLVARELAGEHRVEALDALRRIAVGDGLHFERM
jgi:hypothetical protein